MSLKNQQPGSQKPAQQEELIETEAGLRREISQLGFATISLNGVIGAGIFALPAVAAAATGLFSPWLILICGLLIMPIVLSFARAASFFTVTGGALAYVSHAFGPFAGFQIGWLFTLSRVAATAANTNLMVTYAAWFYEPLGDGLARQLTVSLILLMIIIINIVGVKHALRAIYVFTLLKLLPLGLLVLLGLTKLNPEIFAAQGLPTFDGLGETILVLMYAFVGFESTGVAAGEARNPRRDIPRALVQSVAIVAIIYVLVQWVAISVSPNIGQSKTPLIEVSQLLMGPWGAALIGLGAVFSIIGNVSSMMVSGPRMVYAMGKARVLPQWFSAIHSGFATPANSIAFIGLLSIVLALSGGFVWLAAMSTVVRLIVYAACILSLPKLHTALKPGQQPFDLPGGYTIPLLGLIISLWLITQAAGDSWLFTGVFMVFGTVLYFLAARNCSKIGAADSG
ncbi:MAG: APC family permease [Xanthomonadales bacterium]|nr:APC family permease [Xanthomonadales bacterium]